ncbi:hypothetical protein LTR62_002665 [Meristemomyces frigidus]|uniref:Uncharacterized protein n=1 Tax=Meristemomyces frigidus TaxID=1508187 RepID=A0AAN7TGK1_9PEZI|nr:hypothetical protein LTR62_002665 [Meristemomyces frigidus]
MSAFLKATGVLASLAFAGSAATWSMKQTGSDFSSNALAAAEHGAMDMTSAVKPKLPSNFFQYTVGSYKISNARGI